MWPCMFVFWVNFFFCDREMWMFWVGYYCDTQQIEYTILSSFKRQPCSFLHVQKELLC